MVKQSASGLLVTRAHYTNSPDYLSKLIRGILYGERITTRQFHERYHETYPPIPGQSVRNLASRISAQCAEIYNNEKFMSYYIFSTIVDVLGFDIKEMSITITSEDKSKSYTFNTNMSLKDLDDMCGKTGETMVSDDLYRKSPGNLSTLLRGVLRALGITAEEFQKRYREKYSKLDKVEGRNSSSKISAFKLAIKNNKKPVSFYIFETIMRVIGYRVTVIRVTLEERITKEIKSYATDLSAEDLDAIREKQMTVGISSL